MTLLLTKTNAWNFSLCRCDHITKSSLNVLPNELFLPLLEGLCKTPKWKQCLDYFKQQQPLFKVEQKAYSVIIRKALQENEKDIAWKYLPLAINRETRKRLDPSIFLEYWDYCRRLKTKHDIQWNIDNFLKFITKNQIEVPEDAARELACLIKETKIGESEYFSYNSADKCYVCSNNFPCVTITQQEHEMLTNAIKKNVVIGKSLFSRTTPQELQSFIDLVNRTKPYDFVIDGLNIGYMQIGKDLNIPPQLRAFQVRTRIRTLKIFF